METAFGIVFPTFIMLLDFLCGDISVMSECYSLLENRPYNIHGVSSNNECLICFQVSLIHIYEREMSLNAPAPIIITLLISNES